MKKIYIIFLLLSSIIVFSDVQINGNLESSWTYTLESSPAQFYYNGLKLDLYIKPNDSNFSGELNLNKGSDDKYYITDGEFEFKFDSNIFRTLLKKKSVNTTDWLNAFNNEKIGAVNGFIFKVDLPIFRAENFLVKKDDSSSSLFISHLRGIPLGNFYYSYIYSREYFTKYIYYDWRLFDFNLNLDNTQFFGEFGYSYDKGEKYLDNNYLVFLGNRIIFNNINNAFYLKYLSFGYKKDYLPDSFSNSIRNELNIGNLNITLEGYYNFPGFSLEYLKSYLFLNNYNYLYIGVPFESNKYDLYDSEIFLNIPLKILGNVNISIYKHGLEDNWMNIKKFREFSISSNINGNIFGYYYNLSYIFGNNAVNIENSTVYNGGFSEVLYGTLSKSFGNFNFFGKGMYIYGVIERYKTLYLETKYTGFSNMELLLSLGDGNFGASKEFKKQISLTVRTGF
ncbi:hypothetical protein [Marinitoga sp. 38H-ov]|uniref:hypothetical protein n=1 Tax=Marinitoga sp. 38H-ov TaxID=1755814 RepID=UPI0013EBD44A|nr:hypothetical protein [Marinitoga sp. 38H-ov]KAF2956584.1 hypothetical protein AS160_05145 [Marinitoga sp. 38H-ov]